MSTLAEVKPLTFSHEGKQKAYEYLLKYPGSNFTSFQIIGVDPALSETEFEEVQRAIRVSNDPDTEPFIAPVVKKIVPMKSPVQKASKPASEKSSGESKMKKESNVAVAPKKRGRPKGSKNVASAKAKVKTKGKRGRPAIVSKKTVPTKATKAKTAAKGVRYSAADQEKIVKFILAQGRGGLTKAQTKFGISYPTLARWMSLAGFGKSSAKVDKAPKKLGRPKKTEVASSGHVLISTATIKAFQKGLASLEIGFGHFANALRVLE